jgi:hypothetical protein
MLNIYFLEVFSYLCLLYVYRTYKILLSIFICKLPWYRRDSVENEVHWMLIHGIDLVLLRNHHKYWCVLSIELLDDFFIGLHHVLVEQISWIILSVWNLCTITAIIRGTKIHTSGSWWLKMTTMPCQDMFRPWIFFSSLESMGVSTAYCFLLVHSSGIKVCHHPPDK